MFTRSILHWKQAIQKFEEALQCAICLRILESPCTLTTCSHVFCKPCIEQALSYSRRCPLCNRKATKRCLRTTECPNICKILEIFGTIQQYTSNLEKATKKRVTVASVDKGIMISAPIQRSKKRKGSFESSTEKPQNLSYNYDMDQEDKENLRSRGQYFQPHDHVCNITKNFHSEESEKTSIGKSDNRVSIMQNNICIVSTGLNAKQYTYLRMVIKKIGGANLMESFNENATHLLTGHQHREERVKRTMKLCLGMLTDCHIVSFEWIVHCEKANEWIDATNYELQVTQNRPKGIFQDEFYYLEEYEDLVPSKKEMQQMIQLGEGHIITDVSNQPFIHIIISPKQDLSIAHKWCQILPIQICFPSDLLDRICPRTSLS